MRKREQIESDLKQLYSGYSDKASLAAINGALTLEVLLDIRDLLSRGDEKLGGKGGAY